MRKAERLECRRKFLLHFSRFILSDTQYDNLVYTMPQRDLDNGSIITVEIIKGLYWSRVSWHLREILANIKKQNKLIRCRLDDALWDMEELEKETVARCKASRLNKK